MTMKSILLTGLFLLSAAWFASGQTSSSRSARTGSTLVHPASGSAAAGLAGTTVTMDFDSLQDFSLDFGSWRAVDMDLSPTYTILDHTFPHNGEAMAFIVFNPDSVTPSMASDPNLQAHSGKRFGASFSAKNPPSNDWFISPAIQLKYNGTFSFWVKAYTDQYGPEKYRVAVSTSDSNPSSFTVISGTDPLVASLGWEKKNFSLAAYNNMMVYVAIQCVSNDAYIFMIDDLEVDPGSDTPVYPSSLVQNFDSLPDFTLDFDPWTTVDVRGGYTYQILGVSFPNSGMPMAWINFNPSMAVPPPANMVPHSGKKLGACFSSMPPNNPNDKWLITPKMHLGISAQLELWVMTYNAIYGYENFRIGVSTSSNDPGAFTIISGPEQAPETWTRRNYSLYDYWNQDVYIGIECVSNNSFILLIDDISITSITGMDEPSICDNITLYPNPASERIMLSSGKNASSLPDIRLFNLLGTEVRSFAVPFPLPDPVELDLTGLPPGAYFLKYSNKEIRVTKKLVIR
jgi:hypothetical protein